LNGSAQEKRLDALGVQIQAIKERSGDTVGAIDHHSRSHLAWRMVIELVVGVTIGSAMGYGLDVIFETIPIFIVTFTLLGFAAGIKSMLRSAKELQDVKATNVVTGKKV